MFDIGGFIGQSSKQFVQYKRQEYIYKIVGRADFVKASKSFKELYDGSDLIAEIQVDNPTYYVDDTDGIKASYTPAILKTYKGSYNGNKIISEGGIMNYSDYVKNMHNPIEHKDFVSDESKPNPDKVEYSFAGVPVVKSGDKFIAFCQNFGNSYILTNGYEGLFKENGDSLENNAIKDN